MSRLCGFSVRVTHLGVNDWPRTCLHAIAHTIAEQLCANAMHLDEEAPQVLPTVSTLVASV